jgi:hypothetical protein
MIVTPESRLTEVLILIVQFTSVTTGGLQCISFHKIIHVFESYLKGTRTASGIWIKTPRLVIIDESSDLDTRICMCL